MHSLTPNQHLAVAREIRDVAPERRWSATARGGRWWRALADGAHEGRRPEPGTLRLAAALRRHAARPAHRGTPA